MPTGERDDGLLRGARLHATTEWVRGSDPDLTELERALLAASDEHDKDEFRELAERAARDKRNNRRLRWAVAGAGVLLVAAIVAGGLAAVRGGEAERGGRERAGRGARGDVARRCSTATARRRRCSRRRRSGDGLTMPGCAPRSGVS